MHARTARSSTISAFLLYVESGVQQQRGRVLRGHASMHAQPASSTMSSFLLYVNLRNSASM